MRCALAAGATFGLRYAALTVRGLELSSSSVSTAFAARSLSLAPPLPNKFLIASILYECMGRTTQGTNALCCWKEKRFSFCPARARAGPGVPTRWSEIFQINLVFIHLALPCFHFLTRRQEVHLL
jgi:hypothetical protein